MMSNVLLVGACVYLMLGVVLGFARLASAEGNQAEVVAGWGMVFQSGFSGLVLLALRAILEEVRQRRIS